MQDGNDAREMTFGEKAAGVGFNPGGREDVNECKRGFAALIDNLHNLRTGTTNPEVGRMCSVAITELQTAQMWAVKALTWQH